MSGDSDLPSALSLRSDTRDLLGPQPISTTDERSLLLLCMKNGWGHKFRRRSWIELWTEEDIGKDEA